MADPTPEERAASSFNRVFEGRGPMYVARLADLIREAETAMEIRTREKAMKDAARLVAARCASALPDGCGQCRICYAAKELREEADRA